MKKLIALLLAGVLCFALCACGGDSSESNATSESQPTTIANETVIKATIITNEGTTVEKTAEELFAEYDGNEARFNKLFGGAKIEFVGTVKNIKVDTNVYAGSNSIQSGQNKIVFEEDFTLIIGEENADFDLADYYIGQKLKVVSCIVGAPFDTEFLKTICDNSRTVWLVGNDSLNNETYNQLKTLITPV